MRAGPTVPAAGPTRAPAIAPLRAARAAGGGGARFPEQPAQWEERKKINPRLKLELPPPAPPCGAPPRG